MKTWVKDDDEKINLLKGSFCLICWWWGESRVPGHCFTSGKVNRDEHKLFLVYDWRSEPLNNSRENIPQRWLNSSVCWLNIDLNASRSLLLIELSRVMRLPDWHNSKHSLQSVFRSRLARIMARTGQQSLSPVQFFNYFVMNLRSSAYFLFTLHFNTEYWPFKRYGR